MESPPSGSPAAVDQSSAINDNHGKPLMMGMSPWKTSKATRKLTWSLTWVLLSMNLTNGLQTISSGRQPLRRPDTYGFGWTEAS
eukprot:4303467-Amphidinium_carterae.1